MDFLTKSKQRMQALYSNKIFRRLFFVCIVLIIVYKYSNVKDNIANKNIINGLEIPKKINLIRKAQDTAYIEIAKKDNKNKENQVELQKKLEEEKRIKELKEQQMMEAEALKKEFTTKNANKNAKKLKIGDMVNIKMIIVTNNNFDDIHKPISMVMSLKDINNNFFTKKLIGKKVGDVVTINFKDMLKDKAFKKTFTPGIKNEPLKGMNIDLEQLQNINVAYKIKIISIAD